MPFVNTKFRGVRGIGAASDCSTPGAGLTDMSQGHRIGDIRSFHISILILLVVQKFSGLLFGKSRYPALFWRKPMSVPPAMRAELLGQVASKATTVIQQVPRSSRRALKAQ